MSPLFQHFLACSPFHLDSQSPSIFRFLSNSDYPMLCFTYKDSVITLGYLDKAG